MKKFEFVLNKSLFERIEYLKEKKTKNLSVIVREIILLIIPVLRIKHIYEDRRYKDYKFINATEKIRVFLPEEIYNELKLVHDQLNSFSIATLIRELLEIYFSGIETYGEEKFMKMIQKLKNEIDGLKERKACIVKERVEGRGQDIHCSIETNDYFLLKFNSNFCLKEIKFL
ncbi:MAG TPA: hypothetical protein PLE45_04690 [Spirochaetota bacterium]|nr:hypothetical protein [Spirochaetota bacterium]HOL56598.1 hypothetical protein [Spirochaetota bacterium]HPP04021.1 hypothetical protein [Spirochaetota bacterium]